MDQNPQKSCVLTPTQIEEDQTRTGRPVEVEEHDIDFRVPGLSHAVVKEAEHLRVQELVKKFETHPYREALQADLQQNNVCNPFSNNSKAMIREMGNVELFDLCETIPKVQCSHCLLYWNQGIVYCTCGQFLIDNKSRRKFNKLRLDALSIPHYVIKKGRSKTEEQKEYHQGQWYLTLNKSGKNGPMKLRSDFQAAVSMKNSLHHVSGEQVEEPMSVLSVCGRGACLSFVGGVICQVNSVSVCTERREKERKEKREERREKEKREKRKRKRR